MGMIKSKKDYLFFLEKDRISLGRGKLNFINFVKLCLFLDPIWKFQRLMRKVEFYANVKKGIFYKIVLNYYKYKYHKLSVKLGFSIPINVFDYGLAIVHYGTIVINGNAKVGKNCRIHASTNIGASGGSSNAPILGNNIYIGPGAKIYGNIKLSNNIAIAANAAVDKSFEEENIMIGGVPAKRIKEIEISKIIKHITK